MKPGLLAGGDSVPHPKGTQDKKCRSQILSHSLLPPLQLQKWHHISWVALLRGKSPGLAGLEGWAEGKESEGLLAAS